VLLAKGVFLCRYCPGSGGTLDEAAWRGRLATKIESVDWVNDWLISLLQRLLQESGNGVPNFFVGS
jgi:hypothetical protein